MNAITAKGVAKDLWCPKALSYVSDSYEPECPFPTVLDVLAAKEAL